ncbi:hypothetical protein SCUCBS95973_008934 [Sporothrix curviconia]|uniref:PH domain-containing protein n=1 Tax=Sporothrix curviconia TaxID=1260050 RepID=A0ABP0CQQ2_9PEZI
MPAATDPPPPLKPSRYRTIRGKNVPESRRFVEPTQTPATAASVPTASPASSNRLPTSHSTNSTGTANSSSGGSGYSDISSRRPTPAAPSVPVFSNDRPPMPANGLQNGANATNAANGWSTSDAVQHAPPSPQQHQQYQQQLSSTATTPTPTPSRFRNRPPPLRPARPETSFPAQPPADAPLSAPSPAAAAPTPSPVPVLVPLPSARARGLEHEILAGGGTLDADDVARRDAEAERLLAEQKRKDLERLERELANHQLASANLPPKGPSREKFSFLTRRRGLSSAAPPTPTSPPQTLPDQPNPVSASPISPVGGSSSSRPTTSYTSSRTHSDSKPPLPASLASAAPQMDVPSSAPGSGANRHITIRCRQFTATVDFTAETTVGDALDAATNILPRHINFAGCALIESYTRLGLERRLRRYERIRDILNSWDSDNDNYFIIMLPEASAAAIPAAERSPKEKKGLFSKSSSHDDAACASTTGSVGRNGHASDLDLACVSRSRTTQPPGFTFLNMYHSQKPGRWNKRFITLVEETGQLVASKKADENRLAFLSTEAKSNANNNANGDFQSLCHLSDYDIYTPTEAQMRKNLRPPKTYCFAIKSQQKTTVFLNTDNYVHFFSTDDPAMARTFYDRAFAWRSWYLVNRQLALPRKKKEHAPPPVSMQASSVPPSSSATLRKNTLQRSLSRRSANGAPPIDNARFSTAGSLFGGIGDFDPTLDVDRGDQPQPTPITPVSSDRTRSLRTNVEPSTFTSGGLLGNNYDERKRADSVHHHHQSSSGSFKGTASAAAAAAAVESSWFPSASEHSARQRSKPIRDEAALSVPASRPQSNEDIPLGLQFPQLLQQQQQHQHQHQHQLLAQQQAAGMGRSRSVRRPTATNTPAGGPPMLAKVPALPAPLIDLTPKFQEAPQWSKEGKGHGVRAPVGTAHLVDLATDRNARQPNNGPQVIGGAMPPPSNANLFRRDQAIAASAHHSSSGASCRRSQTMTSSSAAVAAGFSRSRSLAHHTRPPRGEAPPVPLVQRIPGGVPVQEGALPSRERSQTVTRS